MEGGASNGGMLYHEVQESKLCAVHCVNTVLQGPFFSEFDLAAVASDLDLRERQMMMLPPPPSAAASGDFLSEESHNVSLDGDFSIQVLQKALEVWDLHVIPLHSPVAEPAQIDPELENAFICHLHDHWFCIRKVNGEWYNFDSLFAAPMHLSKFYLSAYLDTLRGSGWSIFLVRGNFPKECPIASEASNGYGQWLLPEDADRITKSCNTTRQAPSQMTSLNQQQSSDLSFGETEMLLQMEDEDLKAAIAASLLDSSLAFATVQSGFSASSPVISSSEAAGAESSEPASAESFSTVKPASAESFPSVKPANAESFPTIKPASAESLPTVKTSEAVGPDSSPPPPNVVASSGASQLHDECQNKEQSCKDNTEEAK